MKIIHGDTTIRRRNLPHLRRPGKTYFVTMRLVGTIPHELLKSLQYRDRVLEARINSGTRTAEEIEHVERERSKLFAEYDRYLDTGSTGPKWLKRRECADIVARAICDEDGESASIEAFTVMSNHVHLLLTPFDDIELDKITKRVKLVTSHRCRKITHSTPPFWAEENYDHIMRDGGYARIVSYIMRNPVKAKLCQHWKEWPWTYVKEEIPGLE